MTCALSVTSFRLLDARVGWDPSGVTGLTGLGSADGVQLARADGGPDQLAASDLLPWFPGPRLAPGCGRCAWYLLAPRRGLLRRSNCLQASGEEWEPVHLAGCDPGVPTHPVAIAARGHLLAVVTEDRVLVWRREGGYLAAEIPGPAAAVAFTPWDEILLARPRGTDLERYDLAGCSRGRLATCVSGPIRAVVTGQDWSIWVVSRDDRRLLLWHGERAGGAFEPASLSGLAGSVEQTTLTAASAPGFCLTGPATGGTAVTSCFSWEGVPLTGTEVGAPAPATRAATGELFTQPLDSGLPRCRWHRVQIDADMPVGTSVDVAVATGEEPGDLPYPGDWQDAPSGSLDFLINQPPGRYLFLRMRLRGDGTATPTVRQVRLDFPRVTSAELLPPVYRQDPAADDFSERFLSLFDASLRSVERAVERYPALLDTQGVPEALLPWLGGFLGLTFEPGWDSATRRELLAAAPELYRRRGTPWALAEAIKIVFKADPVIEELDRERNWAALGGGSRVSGARLFGRSAVRFRLDGSALGAAPLHSYGNPDDDPLTAQAHRIRVFLPPGPGGATPDPMAVARLVTDQAPAHLAAQIQMGGSGFIVGARSRLGVDTALTPLPAPVVGPAAATRGKAARLSRDSVLWPGSRGQWCGMQVGLLSAVAVNTVAE